MIRGMLVPLLAVTLALSACHPTVVASTSPPPTAAPTKTATPTAKPTPTPTHTVAPKIALAAISATPDALTLVGADGSTLAQLDYFQSQDAAIAALTDALGFAPQQVTTEGTPNSDNVPYTYYDFEGLRVLGPPSDGGGAGWVFRLSFTVAAVRGIPLSTVDGIQVGADAQSLAAAYPDYARPIGPRLLVAIPAGDGYGVAIFADDPSAGVTSILVPAGV